MDVQALAEEVLDRVAQEIGELGDAQRLAADERRQQPGHGRVRHSGVGDAPFAGVGEQRRILRIRRKIGRAEGLQAMFDGQRGEQRLPVVFAAGELPAGGQVVAQLADQHRRRPHAVVVDRAADPRDQQALARREQRFEEQVAVVLAPRAVARAVVAPHQVEVHRHPRARIVAVVEAEQADLAERDRAHRHQRREGHRAGEEAPRQAAVLELGQPVLADHGQRQGALQAALGAGLAPAFERAVELLQRVGVLAFLGAEEVGQQRTQSLAPFGRGRLLTEKRPGRFEPLEQLRERAERGGVEPTDLVEGLDLVPGTAGGAGRVAEQHAPEAELPGVAGRRIGQAEARAVFGVQPPAHLGAADPALQQRQVVIGDREARAQRGDLDQVEHVADRQPRARQFEQPGDRIDQRVVMAAPLVGDRKRDEARVAAVDEAEHRLDMRRVGLDVGDHDDHVARAQRRVGIEGGEQLIVQHLDLALRAVRDVEADRFVGRQDRGPERARLGERAQRADVVLQLVEQAGLAVAGEEVDALLDVGEALQVAGARILAVVLVEQPDEVAPLLAPGGEQRMRVQVQVLLVERGRHPVAAALAGLRRTQQHAVGDDVGPVVLTGVVHAHQHLAPARQRGEHFERLARQGRDAEDHHPPGQPGRAQALGPVIDPAQEGGMDRGAPVARERISAVADLARDVGEQRAPQRGLPALPGVQRTAFAVGADQHVLAGFPGGEPVGAIDLVLVEEVGEAFGELEALAQVGVALKETAERRIVGQFEQFGQEAHQSPQQERLVEGRGLRHLLAPEHRAIHPPQEGRGQREADAGGDAAAARTLVGDVRRQRQAQPLRDAVALHQQRLAFERRHRVAPHPGDEQVAQVLGVVAMDQHQTGGQRIRAQDRLLVGSGRDEITSKRQRVSHGGFQGCREGAPAAGHAPPERFSRLMGSQGGGESTGRA